MNLTFQILSNRKTEDLKNTLDSISITDLPIQVIFSNEDELKFIKKKYKIIPILEQNKTSSEARNESIKKIETDLIFYLNSGEVVTQGHDQIKNLKNNCYNIKIFNQSVLTKETRIWNKKLKLKFENPIFEILNETNFQKENANVVVYNENQFEEKDLEIIQKWQEENLLNYRPCYYLGLFYLHKKQYEKFLNVSENLLHIYSNHEPPSVLNRYYYCIISILLNKNPKPILQNLSICLSINPLMAEFWCAVGDVYYHIYKDFYKSQKYYLNALSTSKFRDFEDNWPADLSKYHEYPNKMIESCKKILSNQKIFGVS